jgi:hypothetical protein
LEKVGRAAESNSIRNAERSYLTFPSRITHAAAMARQVIERLVDDIDGTEATQSVSFGVDGLAYQIDLNDQHANELRTKLSPFLGVARRVRHEPSRGRARARAVTDKERNSAIRQWALDEGVELPSRGRIAGAVQEAYDAGDVAALYAAAGLEQEEQPAPKRTRRRAANAEFSAQE